MITRLHFRLTEAGTAGIDHAIFFEYFYGRFILTRLTYFDMLRFHKTGKGITLAELLPDTDVISDAGDLLDIMADAAYNGSTGLIIHSATLGNDFFDLRTGLAGEILQKFSNYRMRLAIIGDFTDIKSKALRDFIRESNTRKTVNFLGSFQEAIERLDG